MSEKIPSEEEAISLLRKVGCQPNVVNHCIAVMRVAAKIARKIRTRGLNVNIHLVRVGALLHDIGRSKTHSVNHAVVGGRIARSLSLPDPIISIIEKHVGGGITPEEAERLGWPKGDYMPRTIEEKIVTYADKLVEGSREVSLKRTLDKLKKELGANHPALDRIKRLEKEILRILNDSPKGQTC